MSQLRLHNVCPARLRSSRRNLAVSQKPERLSLSLLVQYSPSLPPSFAAATVEVCGGMCHKLLPQRRVGPCAATRARGCVEARVWQECPEARVSLGGGCSHVACSCCGMLVAALRGCLHRMWAVCGAYVSVRFVLQHTHFKEPTFQGLHVCVLVWVWVCPCGLRTGMRVL